jgi:hypothetical protein
VGVPGSHRRRPEAGSEEGGQESRATKLPQGPTSIPRAARMVGHPTNGAVTSRDRPDVEALPRHGRGFRDDPRDSCSRGLGFLFLTGVSVDGPSSEYVQKAFPKLARFQKKYLPLTIKHVAMINIPKLTELPAHCGRTRDFFLTHVAFLSNPTLYDGVPPPPFLKQTGFTSEEEQLMEGHKFRKHVGEVRGSVYGFKVAQYAKGCSRAVWNCYIKDHFKKFLPHYHLQSTRTISRKLAAIAGPGTIFIQFDFAAYYDQFGIARAISEFFCFLGRNNETFSLTRLPMGFTLACAIAQATTWQLLNFDKRSTLFTCIDNVAFAGSVDDVLHDVVEFLSRVHSVNATLNELDNDAISNFLALGPNEQREALMSWHSDVFTFLGVSYNWSTKSKALSVKTREKLQAVRECMIHDIQDTIAPRQLAAVVGLLRYASFVNSRALHQHFDTLAWVRRVATHLQQDISRWDNQLLSFPQAHRDALLLWLDSELELTATPMFRALPTNTPPTILCDASGEGYGAILINSPSDWQTTSGRWSSHIHSSVTNEPLGVWHAVNDFFRSPAEAPPVVLILSDHLPMVHSSNSLAPNCFQYNQLFRRLAKRFTQTRFAWGYLPGRLNLSDSLSRGIEAKIDFKLASKYAGTGWSNALNLQLRDLSCSVCGDSPLPWQF